MKIYLGLLLSLTVITLGACKKAPPLPNFKTGADDVIEESSNQEPDPSEPVDDDPVPPEDDPEEPGEGTLDDKTETGNNSSGNNNSTTPPKTEEKPKTPTEEKPKVPDTFSPAFKSLDASPKKGDTATFKVTIANAGSKSGKVKVTPLISTKDYDNFNEIKLPSFEVSLGGQESKTAEFKIEPFFKEEGGNREFALNRGTFKFKFAVDGDFKGNWDSTEFKVAPSNAVFTAVYWSQPYLDKQGYRGSIQDYLRETFTRKGQTSDGGNLFASYDKGFDQMMNVRTMFKFYDNWRPDFTRWEATQILNQVEEQGQKRLGLKQPFQGSSGDDMTHRANHGYDMSIGLTENGFGGLAWLGGNTQASGVFDGDPSVGRSQMVLIHETGHNYGSDHCDPIQGFVMCSGEKHRHYTNGEGWFVWHDISIASMKKAKRLLNNNVNFAGTLSLEPIKHQLIED